MFSLYYWSYEQRDKLKIHKLLFVIVIAYHRIYKLIFGESRYFILFYKFIYFIYLFLAALGLRCCAQAFSSCGEQGLLFIAVLRLLIAVASLAAEHGL